MGQMQPPGQVQEGNGLPDFSGFSLIDSFARLPAQRTKLGSLCEIRRASIDEATRTIETALQSVRESADPARAVRLHNAATVHLYKGDLSLAIARFEDAVRIADAHLTENPKLALMRNIDLAALGIAHMRRGEVENCVSNHNADMCIFPLTAAARSEPDRSLWPSSLKSAIASDSGLEPTGELMACAKPPDPLPRSTEKLGGELLFATTKSRFPSPLRSLVVTRVGKGADCKLVRGSKGSISVGQYD